MVIEYLRRADPLGSTDRTEFGQGLIELTWARASWKEKVELFTAQRYALGNERDPLDGCGGRPGFERQAQESKQHALVLAGRGHSDSPTLPRSGRKLQGQAQLYAAQ